LIRSAVAVDDIWTYERAPGRRVVFPWRAPGLPDGVVQVDMVIGEALVEPARRMIFPAADRGCISVRAAGPAQSLAWKLLWLATDFYPQGKDLYDAVLLAERFALPYATLERAFSRTDARALPGTASEFVSFRDVDWNNFRAEYPNVGDRPDEWLNRLRRALEPTFAERSRAGSGTGSAGEQNDEGAAPSAGPGPLSSPDELPPSWLTPTVVGFAKWIDDTQRFEQLPILADALEDAGCDAAELLTHLRSRGPHTRGCRAVDLLLGKG
jgi:hypothetical protein